VQENCPPTKYEMEFLRSRGGAAAKRAEEAAHLAYGESREDVVTEKAFYVMSIATIALGVVDAPSTDSSQRVCPLDRFFVHLGHSRPTKPITL
jgi:hypothetical protein